MNQVPWDSRVPYKRKHSMESWLRERDEDLALFQDMRARERHDFLHPSNDDIEATLSTKFGGLSGYRLSSSLPTRKGAGDLLTADVEKNDYDWLLTPPGTPLFPSLDQDSPVIDVPQRGALSRSPSTSKTSRLSNPHETSSRTTRGNASPRRPGTASSTSSTNSTARGRVSTPSITSSSPTLRPSMSSGRSSTPTRSSTTGGRSSIRSPTPTLRRTNTTPASYTTSVVKAGSSTGKTRGNSLSPKLRAWQPTITGFSSEAPPNLRTSISDRSPSASRGGSFGVRQSGTCGARDPEALEIGRSRWQLTSPTISRRSISPNSQTSRGSVFSSCDDEMETAQSSMLGNKRASPECADSQKVAARIDDQLNGKYALPVKRQTRGTPAFVQTPALVGVVSKKSLEPSMRPMDQSRSSQGMFRPLLSSIPTTSFYSTRPIGTQCRPASPAQESSITISSNASSEQGLKIVPHDESSDDDREDTECAWEKSLAPEISKGNLNLDENDLTSANWTRDACNRHTKHNLPDLERHDIDSNGSEDVHPCRSADGCEINEVEVDLSADWKQHEVLPDEIWSNSRARVENQRINQLKGNQIFFDDSVRGSVDDGLSCLESRRDDFTAYSSEENTDHLFVDIQEDLSVQSHANKILDPQLCELDHNTRHHFQSSGPEGRERDHSSIQNFALEQEAVKYEAIPAQKSNGWSSQEPHGLICYNQRKADLDIDLKQQNNLDEVLPRDQHALEQFKTYQSGCGQLYKSNSNVQRFRGYHSYGHDDRIDSVAGAQSPASTIYPELSYKNGLIDVHKPEAKLLCLSRMDYPVIDAAPSEKSNSVRTDINLRLHDRAMSMERLVSCEAATPSSFLPSQNLVNQRKIAETEGWVRKSSSMPDCLLNTGYEMTSMQREAGLYGYQSKLASEESCRDYFVDVIVNPESRISETTGICVPSSKKPEKTALVSERFTSPERRENPEVCNKADAMEKMALDSCDELGDAALYTVMKSSLLDAVHQGCNSIGNLCTEDSVMFSYQVPENSSEGIVGQEICLGERERTASLDDITVQAGFSLGEIHPNTDASSEKTTENEKIEMQTCDSGSSLVGPKLGDTLAVEMQEQSECSKKMHDKSMPEGMQQDYVIEGNTRKCHSEMTLLSRNITLEEATDTILFCSSIVHDLVYRAASIAIEKEGVVPLATLSPKGLTGAGLLSYGNWKGKHVGPGSAVSRTYVQNQKVILRQAPRQAPTVTIQQSPMDRTESAVIETQETLTQETSKVHKDKIKANIVPSRCSCIVM